MEMYDKQICTTGFSVGKESKGFVIDIKMLLNISQI